MGIRGARRRRILRCQFADLVQWGRACRGDGSEKARVARGRDVEGGNLRKRTIGKLTTLAGAVRGEQTEKQDGRGSGIDLFWEVCCVKREKACKTHC